MNEIDIVLGYIDNYYRNAIQRPAIYFSSPESYEDVVMVLESMRDAVIPLKAKNDIGSYADYLVLKGFGSANFTSRYRLDHAKSDINIENLFKEYTHFLTGYLQSQGRLSNE